jgi:hypothetical protein
MLDRIQHSSKELERAVSLSNLKVDELEKEKKFLLD